MTSKRWTIRRKQAVEAWVHEVKAIMALGDWTIHFNWDGDEHTNAEPGEEPGALATMTSLPYSKHASMAISRKFLEMPPMGQTHTLVHELSHCHLFAIHQFSAEGFNLAVTKNKLATELHEQALNQHIETTTDALADAFYTLVPALELD